MISAAIALRVADVNRGGQIEFGQIEFGQSSLVKSSLVIRGKVPTEQIAICVEKCPKFIQCYVYIN